MKLKIALASILIFILLSLFALQSKWAKEIAQRTLMSTLKKSGYTVEIGTFEGKIPYAIDLKNVKLDSDTLSVSIDSLQIRFSIWALLKKELLFTEFKGKGIAWQVKPSAPLSSLKKREGLPLSLKINHFSLVDVHVDHIDANFQGSLRVGRKNRECFLDIFASSASFPSSNLHLLARLSNDALHFKGALQSPLLQMRGKGKAKLDETGRLETARLFLKANDPKWNAKCELAAVENGFSLKVNGNIPELGFHSLFLKKTQVHLNALWQDESLQGEGVALSHMNGKTLKGKTDFYWKPGGSLYLTDSSLQSTALQATGNLEIRPDAIFIGHTEATIENLQELPLGLYGQLQVKTDWLISNGKQVATLEADSTEVYWKDLYAAKISVNSSLIDPFGKPQGQTILHCEDVKWHKMHLDQLQCETLIGASNQPFTLSAKGEWIHPLELHLDGVWLYENSALLCSLNTGSGSFYNHPLRLTKSVDFEYAPDLLRFNGLDLALSNSRLFLSVEENRKNTAIELILEQFPLDVFSLNPLDVAIHGQADCIVSIQENNGQVKGTISASIQQLERALPKPPKSSLTRISHRNERKVVQDAALDFENREEVNIASILTMSGLSKDEAADCANFPRLCEKCGLNLSGKLEGSFDNDLLALKSALLIRDTTLISLQLSLPIHFELRPLQAQIIYEKSAQGHLTLNGQVEEILDFFDLGTHRIEGHIASDFRLSNSLLNPAIQGNLHFEQGSYENYLTGTRLMDIRAEGKAHGNIFNLDTFTAQGEQGAISATGTISLLPAQLFPYLFNISFSRFQVAQIDLVHAEIDGNLQIVGNLRGATGKGEVEVIESDLHIPDRIPRSLPNLVVVYRNVVKPIEHPEPTTPSKPPFPFQLDLEVKAPSGVFIDGRGLHSEWRGNFHIGNTYTSIAAQGKLELIKGEFLFAGRRFKLLDGSLSFAGLEHEMPYLNLAAQIEVKEISITARLKGPLNNPQLTLQSTPPLPLSKIMSYLLFGQEIAEINSFQALQLANSLAAFAGQGPDVLESTRKTLGVDRLNVVSIPSGDGGAEEVLAIQVGKYVSEGVLVSLTQGAEESSTNISIEIDLNSGWVVQLESDQRQEQGKFTIKWNHTY